MNKLHRLGSLRWCRAAALGAALFSSGCVMLNTPEKIAQVQETRDPLEPFNRTMFEFNLWLDRLILRPTAVIYRQVVPEPVRNGVNNALFNLRHPRTFLNDVVQLSPERAYVTLVRFAVNSTVGVLGVMDVAKGWGYPGHEEDFGQTLGAFGVSEGPYLVLPLFGPSNFRDAAGFVVDSYADPVNYIARDRDRDWVPIARVAATGINTRSRNIESLDDVEKKSIDFYATIRSLYRQRRSDEIRNGQPGDMDPGMTRFEGSAARDVVATDRQATVQ